MESHVTSLELSKKLKLLNVPQKSLFYWHKDEGDQWEVIHDVDSQYITSCFSAFLSSELGKMLPEEVETESSIFFISIDKVSKQWGISYCNGKIIKDSSPIAIVHDKTLKSFISETEADARAKMIIYLIENKLIDVKKI